MSGNIIWQSMSLDYFYQLVTEDKLKLPLKHLKLYGIEERRQYSEIIDKIRDIMDKKLFFDREEIGKMSNKLRMWFSNIDLCTYISCFYDVHEPSANLLKQFGGNIGVSVGFDKNIVCEAVNTRYEADKLDSIWRKENVKYISYTYDKVAIKDKLINFTKLFLKREEFPDIIKLRDLVVEFLFQKSANYTDEQEFRIVYGINPKCTCTAALEHLDLRPEAIKKIAIFAGRESMTYFIKFLSQQSKKYSFTEDGPSEGHPLKMYTVKIKDNNEDLSY